MAGFLDNDPQDNSRTEEKYLKFPEVEEGKKYEVRVRFLDAKPEHVFRHWIGPEKGRERPYNCPSLRGGCPACAERAILKDQAALLEGQEAIAKTQEARDLWKMDKRYLLNALVYEGQGEPVVRIVSFGQGLGGSLDLLHDTYGDVRDYDITIIKRKTGSRKFDVEYAAIYDDERKPENRRQLSDAEKSISENRFDLATEIKPTEPDVIQAALIAAKGGTLPENPNGFAGPELIKKLSEKANERGFTLADLEVHDTKKLTVAFANELLNGLS